MSKKIYLIREYGGEYEDSWERIVYAFMNKDNRDAKLKELNDNINEIESYRKFWDDICLVLENIEYPEEYYEYINGDHDSDEELCEIYENYTPEDSFERFTYWMQECMNDTYVQHDETFWKNLYDYYHVNGCQYGNMYTSYFDVQDVDIMDVE